MDLPGKPSLSTKLPTDQRFPKSVRIHSSLEFDRLFRSGKVLADAMLVMHATEARAQSSGRIGISISKRVGSAPLRNRWKRLIREAYRRQLAGTGSLRKLDIVVRPRRGAQPSYSAIERSLVNLAQRLVKQLQVKP